MRTISPFPKIFHIGDSLIPNLFKGKVEISEKIDGSQWSWGINEDKELVFRSKGEDLTEKGVNDGMFLDAKKQTDRIYKLLKKKKLKDIYFYSEYLQKPKHNVLAYSRIPKNNLYLFGVMENGEFISDYKKLWEYADLLEIERVNIIYQGEIKNTNELTKFLDNDSILGKEKIEGIVVKNYNEPSGKGSFVMPISMGKYVREDFKERHKVEFKTTKGDLQMFIESFRTEARWQKAIQHLKEKGELENSPRDIGNLIKEIQRDLLEEETENIKEELFKLYKDDFTRKAIAGFPEWYKKKLLENSLPLDKQK